MRILLNGVVAASAFIMTSFTAQAQTLNEGFSAMGNAGIAAPNGIISEVPATVSNYYYVSTNGGENGVGSLSDVGGNGSPTNGSTLKSDSFAANAGDSIVFYFDYVTSDGSGFADYSWARLLNAEDDSEKERLFTARTTPGGDTVPGFAMPAPTVTLDPATTPINPGGPEWDQLGSSSGSCYASGCGHTDWVKSSYEISESGNYRLEFGATNWNDTAFDSGMAIAEATPAFSPVPGPKDSGNFITAGKALVGDLGENFDPNKPTVVVTHGWQPDALYTGTIDSVPITKEITSKLRDRVQDDANIVAYMWSDAHFESNASAPGKVEDTSNKIADTIGADLAKQLENAITSDYDKPLHFLGHSLGSDLNAHAARNTLEKGFNVGQVTTLDAPLDTLFGKGQISDAPYLYLAQNTNIPLLDNYYGTKKTKIKGPFSSTIGSSIEGWEIDGGTAWDADHSGVWSDYKETIGNTESKDGFYYSLLLGDQGGYNDIADEEPVELFSELMAPMTPTSLIGADFNAEASVLDLATSSNGYAAFDIDVPESATALMFDMFVDQAGTGDWLEISFNDELNKVLEMSAFEDFETEVIVGIPGIPSDINDLYFLLVDQAGTGSSLTASNFSFMISNDTAIAPIPLPASGVLLIGGLAGLAALRRRRGASTIRGVSSR